MAWTDAAVGGGLALAGVVVQQAFAVVGEARRRRVERQDRRHDEQHQALVDLVRAGRRVQRRMVDCCDRPDEERIRQLAMEVNSYAEARAVIRFVLEDAAVLRAAEGFERIAKDLLRSQHWDSRKVQLRFLIDAAQAYEKQATNQRR